MSKKDFIALADVIKERFGSAGQFNSQHVVVLADFCETQNPHYKRRRWLDYIAGKCRPNGGKI
jgi:hypothetical protein